MVYHRKKDHKIKFEQLLQYLNYFNWSWIIFCNPIYPSNSHKQLSHSWYCLLASIMIRFPTSYLNDDICLHYQIDSTPDLLSNTFLSHHQKLPTQFCSKTVFFKQSIVIMKSCKWIHASMTLTFFSSANSQGFHKMPNQKSISPNTHLMTIHNDNDCPLLFQV